MLANLFRGKRGPMVSLKMRILDGLANAGGVGSGNTAHG